MHESRFDFRRNWEAFSENALSETRLEQARSRAWRGIKYVYNRSPALLQKLLIWIFIPIIYAAKWLVTRRNPVGQTRGMDFYYDIVDWVGGYPYEVATAQEVRGFLQPLGFVLDRFMAATVPTGCNQFVFRRVS